MVSNRAISRRFLLGAFSLLLVLLLSACTSKPTLYRWGEYETQLYQMYVTNEGSDPSTQAKILREEISRTQAEGHRVPPGVHAHLAFLYYSTGDLAAAREEFLKEKELFPESATFVDGILRRMDKRNKRLGSS